MLFRSGVRPAQLLVIGAAWLTPLALGPALFSRDVYSYLAQGEILHLGLDPYHVAPVVLGRHGQGQILAAVSPFWRGTTAPYGSLLLALLSLIVSLSGSNLIVGVLLIRLLELGGIALLVVFVPRLARAVVAEATHVHRHQHHLGSGDLQEVGAEIASHPDAALPDAGEDHPIHVARMTLDDLVGEPGQHPADPVSVHHAGPCPLGVGGVRRHGALRLGHPSRRSSTAMRTATPLRAWRK